MRSPTAAAAAATAEAAENSNPPRNLQREIPRTLTVHGGEKIFRNVGMTVSDLNNTLEGVNSVGSESIRKPALGLFSRLGENLKSLPCNINVV